MRPPFCLCLIASACKRSTSTANIIASYASFRTKNIHIINLIHKVFKLFWRLSRRWNTIFMAKSDILTSGIVNLGILINLLFRNHLAVYHISSFSILRIKWILDLTNNTICFKIRDKWLLVRFNTLKIKYILIDLLQLLLLLLFFEFK